MSGKSSGPTTVSRGWPVIGHSDPAHDAVTDADRGWFEANPHRRHRLRPVTIAELPPGSVLERGSMMLVVHRGNTSMRLRQVVRPPFRLRRGTEADCAELLHREVRRRPDLAGLLAELARAGDAAAASIRAGRPPGDESETGTADAEIRAGKNG